MGPCSSRESREKQKQRRQKFQECQKINSRHSAQFESASDLVQENQKEAKPIEVGSNDQTEDHNKENLQPMVQDPQENKVLKLSELIQQRESHSTERKFKINNDDKLANQQMHFIIQSLRQNPQPFKHYSIGRPQWNEDHYVVEMNGNMNPK